MARTRRALAGLLLAALAVTAGAAPAFATSTPAEPRPAADGPVAEGPTAGDPAAGDPVAAPDATGPDAGAPDPDAACTTPSDGYAPPGRCELVIARATALCVGDAPVLDYAVEPYGTPNDTVTLTWVNPDGDAVVQSGLPLSGRVYWPGTVLDGDQVVDWPGWSQQPDGTWVQHDEFDFSRPVVRLEFEVNPSASTVVAYPPATSACAGPQEDVDAVVVTPPDSEVSGVVTASEVLAAPATQVRYQSAVLAVTGANSWQLLAAAGGAVLLGAGLVVVASRRAHRAR
ncbi:peptidase [Cellulomonas sp. C5510]|uniref:peptidase n=1 Tax=Cellulomonas sp. C5510 TaxID=2871170 RepID=UPI001C95536A|nr:peptidase [Cellulomonas sp. C5510]QZN86175.1 peptidase [Cellulomonas sp. C5510]